MTTEVAIWIVVVAALVGLGVALLLPPVEKLPDDDEDRLYGGGW